MKILHICETARGGVGTYIDMLTRLEEGKAQSRVIVPDAHQHMISRARIRHPFRYPARSVGSLLRMAAAGVKARFHERPDIVFCHSSLSLLALIVLRPLSPGTKFIYCSHGWAGAREMANTRKAALVRKAEGLLCTFAHLVVNISEGELDHATRYGYRGRHVVIENAVWPARADVVPAAFEATDPVSGKPVINLLFVGRFDRQKGLDILLAAFDAARTQAPWLRLHVVGEAVISEGAAAQPIAGVTFCGWIGADQIDTLYAAADLVIVPSRWEGFGLVVAEACRNATPVLVSQRGALPFLIEENVSGFSVPLSIETFTRALVGLDLGQLRSMRPAALALYEKRFRAERLGAAVQALYHDLMTR